MRDTDVHETPVPGPSRRFLPAWLPIRVALAVALVTAVGIYAYVTTRPSTTDKLEARFGDGALCMRAGIMAFAGSRSTLYSCSWSTFDRYQYETVHKRCGIWADGAAYDVTRQARALARLSGERRPC